MTTAAQPPHSVEVLRHLSAHEIEAATHLVERATEHDGVRPLSEHVMLHLRHGGDADVRHVLAWSGDELLAFAHLDSTDAVAGSSAEFVVDPSARNHGLGGRILDLLRAESPDGRLRVWAHGDTQAARALAQSRGFDRGRVLWQMRSSLAHPLPAAQWADGYRVRTFVAGVDDDEWLALNREAFADHPEQGTWTAHDLRVRMNEPWFDADGFFLAEQQLAAADHTSASKPALVGFHWTKVHGADDAHGHPPIGEIYVIGVAPAASGHGVGRALAVAGLTYLRQRGLAECLLYVEADNLGAIRLYESLGFQHHSTDVMYAAPAVSLPSLPDREHPAPTR